MILLEFYKNQIFQHDMSVKHFCLIFLVEKQR